MSKKPKEITQQAYLGRTVRVQEMGSKSISVLSNSQTVLGFLGERRATHVSADSPVWRVCTLQ